MSIHSMLLAEDPPLVMSRGQVRKHALFYNGLQIGAGILLIPTSLVLWWLSFRLVRWMFAIPLEALGMEGWTISLYIAWITMVALAIEGARYSAPLFELGTFTQSEFYDNWILRSDTGFALNWYYGSPIQIMWLVSQFLFCAPRSGVLAVKTFRSLAPADDETIAQATAIRRELAKSRKWTPAAQFSHAPRALLLLERLELIWVDRDRGDVEIRISNRGD